MASTKKARLEILPATPAIGAFVTGIDLAKLQPDDVMRAIHRAFHQHGVLFFPDQDALEPATQMRFAAWFGTLRTGPSANGSIHVHPQVRVVDETGGSQTIGWHTVGSFEEKPPLGCLVRAIDVPPNGGDTLWASMVAAYDTLSPVMRSFVEGLNAVHDTTKFTRCRGLDPARHQQPRRCAIHPVVVADPVTGRRAIFVNPLHTTHIIDLSPAESDSILSFLFAHCASPNLQVRLRWAPGMVAFWHNRITQQFTADDFPGSRRVMHCVTIDGAVSSELWSHRLSRNLLRATSAPHR
jgi:taurine dioxygenase